MESCGKQYIFWGLFLIIDEKIKPVSFPWWEIQLSYKVHGSGKSVAADGMGLFLVKERTKQGSAIGGPERFQGMAILLDSYKNGGTTGNFPLVSFNFLLSITYYFQRFLVLFQTERGISIMIQMALIKISENAFLVIETNKNQVFFVSGKFFFDSNFS